MGKRTLMRQRQLNRADHEAEALRNTRIAEKAVRYYGHDCTSAEVTAYEVTHLIEANRSIAHARSHMVSIGLQTPRGKTRHGQLWRFVSKVDKKVREANQRFKLCMRPYAPLYK